MASFNYINDTAPFWDFIASLEQQGNNHPFFGQNRSNDRKEHGESYEDQIPQFDPWGWGHQLFGGARGVPHRGPPPSSDPHNPPLPHHGEDTPHYGDGGDKDGQKSENDNDDNDNGEGPSGSGSGSDGEGEHNHGRRRHGHCGSRRDHHGRGGRGSFGPYRGRPGHHGPRGHHGPPHNGPGRGPRGYHHGPPPPPESPYGSPRSDHAPWGHHGSHHHGGPGRQGYRGRGGHFGGPCRGFGGVGFNPSALAAQFFEAFAVEHPSNNNNNNESTAAKENEDFTPETDIFDTPSAYVIHISLPGAKKEDVGINWDAEKSELVVTGVIYRPGDEELLKTLAMNERKVGLFGRKIRLGTRANPAHVDADGITAKLEDGVLRVEVGKESEGFVEIKKVDIE